MTESTFTVSTILTRQIVETVKVDSVIQFVAKMSVEENMLIHRFQNIFRISGQTTQFVV
jgi:hypothetical protein